MRRTGEGEDKGDETDRGGRGGGRRDGQGWRGEEVERRKFEGEE